MISFFLSNLWVLAFSAAAVYLLVMMAWWAFCGYFNGLKGYESHDRGGYFTDWALAASWGGVFWPIVAPIALVVGLVIAVLAGPVRLYEKIFDANSEKAYLAQQRSKSEPSPVPRRKVTI